MKKTQAIILLFLIFVFSLGIGIAGSWGFLQIRVANDDALYVESSTNFTRETSTDLSENKNLSDNYSKDDLSKDNKRKQEEVENFSQKVESFDKKESIKGVSGDTVREDLSNRGDYLSSSRNAKIDMSKEIKIDMLDGPNPNAETRTYSFSVSAIGGLGSLTYYLYPVKNAKDTLVSSDGNFEKVSPCSNGKYILQVQDAYGNELKQEVTGFISILKKLTPQELTSRLSKASPDNSLKNYFPQGRYSITFAGIKSGDPIPTTYTQIYSNIASGYWSRVKVTNIEYNDYNKITRVYISVYYN